MTNDEKFNLLDSYRSAVLRNHVYSRFIRELNRQNSYPGVVNDHCDAMVAENKLANAILKEMGFKEEGD